MNTKVSKVYAAETLEQNQAAYDDWADAYERDLMAMGYRLPPLIAAAFARHVAPGSGPILDAGCGGGLQVEPLAALGYGPFTGIDLSPGMLAVAHAKGLYAELKEQTLGERLDFADDSFAAVISAGTITPGHAPAHTMDELVRVCRPGGMIVMSLRCDAEQEPAYPATVERLTATGAWRIVQTTGPIQTMPYGEPDVRNLVHICEVL